MIRIGTLGAAAISPNALTKPAANNADVQVTVVAARDRSRAEEFAEAWGIGEVVDSYDEVVTHPDVDAIYNPLPISHHREYTIKALRAGKHVLCEKSFACNEAEAREMADVAQETGLVLIEAFHYRYHPVFQRALELYHDGAIGDLVEVEGAFNVGSPRPGDIRMIYATGGGATMDMGCYPLSWVRHFTGEEPEVVSAKAEEGPPDVDILLQPELLFPSGARGRTSGIMKAGQPFEAYLNVTGTRGKLNVRNPLVPHMGHNIELVNDAGTKNEELTLRPTYEFQLDAFVDAVENGTKLETDAEDGVRQMRLIDNCYRAAGMKLRGMRAG